MKSLLTIAATLFSLTFALQSSASDLNPLWHGRWAQSDTDQLSIDANKIQIKTGAEQKSCAWSKDGKAPSTKGCWATYEGKILSKNFDNQEVAGADENTRDLIKVISKNETFKSVRVFEEGSASSVPDKSNCTWSYIYDKATIYKKGDCKRDGTVMLVLQKYAKK
jgi:hypothetical protein